MPTVPEDEPTKTLIDVLYATDRNQTGSMAPDSVFGTERGEMRYGVSRVAISIDENRSRFANPMLWPRESGETNGERAQLRTVSPLGRDEFLADLSRRIERSTDRGALVYIHGYARSFEQATTTAAVLAFELSFAGVPVAYSWPSAETVKSYSQDVAAVDWSTPHLRQFLDDVARGSDARTVHIIAHSLGNRALLNALIGVLQAPADDRPWQFGEIVLVAPDVSRERFELEMAPRLAADGLNMTLYVSKTDVALLASLSYNRTPRLGDASLTPSIVDGVDTIDAYPVAGIITPHAYYRRNPQVLADLHYLITQRRTADARPTLIPVQAEHGRYWEVVEYN